MNQAQIEKTWRGDHLPRELKVIEFGIRPIKEAKTGYIQYFASENVPNYNDLILYFQKTQDGVEVETALQYNDGYAETLFSFANNINTVEGGTHLSGFKSALTRAINQYAKSKNLLKDDLTMTGEDVREGLTAVISVKIPNPQFEGQTKTKLGNSEVEGLTASAVFDAMSSFFEENPSIANKMTDKVNENVFIKHASQKDINLRRGFWLLCFAINGLPWQETLPVRSDCPCLCVKTIACYQYLIEFEKRRNL